MKKEHWSHPLFYWWFSLHLICWTRQPGGPTQYSPHYLSVKFKSCKSSGFLWTCWKWPWRRTGWLEASARSLANEDLAELGQAYNRKRKCCRDDIICCFREAGFALKAWQKVSRETSFFSEPFYRSTVKLDVWPGQCSLLAICLAHLRVSSGRGWGLSSLPCQVHFLPCLVFHGKLLASLIFPLLIT